LVWP